MITKEKKVYYCEHCNKHMLTAGGMARHEKFCKNHPNNRHMCFKYCKHLQKGNGHYNVYEHVDGYGEVAHEANRTEFTCAASGKCMYSYKLEKKGITDFEGRVRMPLECGLFEPMPGHETYTMSEEQAAEHYKKKMDEIDSETLPY